MQTARRYFPDPHPTPFMNPTATNAHAKLPNDAMRYSNDPRAKTSLPKPRTGRRKTLDGQLNGLAGFNILLIWKQSLFDFAAGTAVA